MFTICVNMKQLGKRKNSIQEVTYELEQEPHTVRELITQVVHTCVTDYNQRMENRELLRSLTKEEIQEQAAEGKVSFGVNYGEHQAKEPEALENALQSFEDGIYRIFLDEHPLEQLEDSLALTEHSQLTFVRLVMLAGRLY